MKLFLKGCSDHEFDLDTHHGRCKTVFWEMCAGALYGKSPSLLTEGRNYQLVPFSQLGSEMSILGQIFKCLLSQRLSHHQWTHWVENSLCDK